MDPWLVGAADRLAADTGVERFDLELPDWDAEHLLRIARTASEQSGARTNAPLLCYLLGIAAGRTGVDVVRLSALFPE